MRVAPVALRWICCSAVVLAVGAGEAGAAPDCPPVGPLPNYLPVVEEAQTRNYHDFEFTVKKGNEAEPLTVAGRLCRQSYALKEGANPKSDLDIQTTYREQLSRAGASLMYSDDRTTVARLAKGADETWVNINSQETEFDVTVVVLGPFKPTLTSPSGRDYRLLGHMPDYIAAEPETRDFDELTFTVHEGDGTRDVTVKGRLYTVSYALKEGANPASDLEIQQNYRAALRALGAKVLFEDGRYTHARIENAGQSIWIQVYSQETEIEIGVIEEKRR